MNIDILTPLNSMPYFTIEAVRQLFGDKDIAFGSIRTYLYRWMKAGKIIQLKKGTYMTLRFFETHRSDVDFTPMVSAILIPQSYVSMEYILQREGVLTDITYTVSAITLKQTRTFENQMGVFTYRNLKASLYTGYTISEYLGVPISRATKAKALFDMFYLRPLKITLPSIKNELAESLRLNLEDFSKRDQLEFAEFVVISKSRKMDLILRSLRRTVWHP
ncbi:MAG: hypothetical protein HPY72_09125 [Anaerolineae bacterium]|jgi:hypothetical protein|nr:hypothetical protein [Anaerolineae bacterium]